MSKVLVTGGLGFIGSHLVDQLIEEGQSVTVWDNLKTGKMENLNKRAKFDRICVDDKQDFMTHGTIHRVPDDLEIIFHMAAEARIQPSFHYPWLVHDTNTTGTANILELARQRGAKVVFAGSSSVYHDMYANPYTFTKQIGENYCTMYNKVYDTPVAIARFFNVYGPRQLETGAYATVIGIFEKQWREKKPLTVTGDGLQRRDFTHVSDIVAGLIAMSKQKWKADIFNLGTGTNHSIIELSAMFHTNIEFIPKRRGEADTTLADTSFSQEKLGWSAKVRLEEYVDSVLNPS